MLEGVGIVFSLILATLSLLYFYLSRNLGYWKKKGVVYVKPKFPLGTIQELFIGKQDAGSLMKQLYMFHKQQGLRYYGVYYIFNEPSLDIIDLDLCKHLLVKDFNSFVSRNLLPQTYEYITKHLFNLEGQEWRAMRMKLNPTFTSGRMKDMFPLMVKCASRLTEHLDKEVMKDEEFEVKNLTARFTADVIASCAFGLETDCIKDKKSTFFGIVKNIFQPKKSHFVKIFLIMNFPELMKLFRVGMIGEDITDLLKKVMRETEEYRRKNGVVRNDFVDLLIKVKKHMLEEEGDYETEKDALLKPNGNGNLLDEPHRESKEDCLTLEEMTAQAFVFVAAGYDSSSSVISFCLHELAKNQEVQNKLIKEIDKALSAAEGFMTYKSIHGMVYLDQVVNETLRMYPPQPVLTRLCSQPYRLPGSDLVIDKGVRVNVPVYAIHHDPQFYPDPYRFDPDRFSEDKSRDRHPYAFLPFGEGPRHCIGMRFGRLQVKTGLVAVLSRYKVSLASDTPLQLEINPLLIFTTPTHPFKLKITRR